VKIEIHNTPALFDVLAAEWDALLPASNSLNFFMRSTWQRIWWKNLGQGDLVVLTVRDDQGALIGVAPLYCKEDSQGALHLGVIGGVDVTDYVDLVYAPGRERQVIEAVWGFLCADQAPAWQSLQVRNVPQSSPTLQLLKEIATGSGCRVEDTVEDVCPVLDLPETYEGYLETLGKKDRHELRRKRRKAEANGAAWVMVGAEHNLEAEIDAFLGLMALYTPEKAEFLKQPGHKEFFWEIGPAIYGQGMLDLCFLTVEGRKAAAMWSFTYGDRVMLYNSGLDPSGYSSLSPGIVLLTYTIEHAIGRGLKKYDFLQGNEDYKYRMGAQDTTVHNLIIER
jgi:CelD/BcsL family acetyltransferase involved in cellulose biosynthesis